MPFPLPLPRRAGPQTALTKVPFFLPPRTGCRQAEGVCPAALHCGWRHPPIPQWCWDHQGPVLSLSQADPAAARVPAGAAGPPCSRPQRSEPGPGQHLAAGPLLALALCLPSLPLKRECQGLPAHLGSPRAWEGAQPLCFPPCEVRCRWHPGCPCSCCLCGASQCFVRTGLLEAGGATGADLLPRSAAAAVLEPAVRCS